MSRSSLNNFFKLWRDYKPALFGGFVIFVVVLIAFFGLLIVPDRSVNANQGITELRKAPTGTEIKVLKRLKSFDVTESSFFTKLFAGNVPDFVLIPYHSFIISEDGYLHITSSKGEIQKLPLIIFIQQVLKDSNGLYFTMVKQKIYFESLDGRSEMGFEEAKELFFSKALSTRKFLLGADGAGRDVFSRLIYGAKVSVSVGIVSVSISLFIGVLIGALAGYSKGLLDNFLMWLVTVVWSIPGIMIIIAISLALNSKGIWVVFVAVGLTMWVDVARVVRGQFLEAREYLYVEAAQALGASKFRVIWRHILPNVLGPIIVMATANFASAILIEAGLSFIGIGVEPPTPSWGAMVREGYNMMSSDIVGSTGAFTILLYPSLCISLLVFSFNLLGNGLRDALDPKS